MEPESATLVAESSAAAAPAANEKYSVGTLRYTKFTLAKVFFWLIWGDFIWTLLDGCIPGVLPLKLKDLGASDTLNQALNKSLGCAVSFMLTPAISMHSDRHRGPRGRRIPYMLWTTPFVGLFLVLIGCYESLANLAMGQADSVTVMGIVLTRKAITLFIFAALFLGYDLANSFVGTVFWYLFNDVVPPAFLGRFFGFFRMFSSFGGMLYSGLIFKHSLTHFRLIFVLAGIGYIAGFMLMCLNVKEGEYPPPRVNVNQQKGFWGSIQTFYKECFTHKFYWFFYLAIILQFLSWQCGTFATLRNRDSLKLNMEQLGNLGFWTGLVSLVLSYPTGWLVDKWNPIRVYILMNSIAFLGPLAQCIWIFTDFGPERNLFWQYVLSLIFLPIGALNGAAELPMYMRLLPRDRYGQFSAAMAMLRAFVLIFGALAAGVLMDVLAHYWGMDEWRYRYYALWTVAFQIPSLFFFWLLYREWKALGGDKSYKPPEV